MGTHVIKVPDVGEGIAEVEVVAWAVTVGQAVTRNQVLAEVMTDKANVEIPAPTDGVVATLHGEVGGTLAVGTALIELTVEGEGTDPEPDPAPSATGAPTETTPPPSAAPPATVATATAPVVAASPDVAPQPAPAGFAPAPTGSATMPTTRPPRAEGERPLATPAVRHRAREAGIDLRLVPGTGPAGRITHTDLDTYWQRGATAPARLGAPGGRSPNEQVERQPIIGIRRRIAERMVAATTTIPHITYVDEVDVTALEDLRAALNQRHGDRGRLTILPFLIRAMVDAIAAFPQMNAHVDDNANTLVTYGGVHVGIATQTDNGLVVPVVRHAETLGLWELAERIATGAEAARTNQATAADLTGSTITITSLGALGGLVTTPVINKPEVAIVGVNKIVTRPVYRHDPSTPVPAKIMNLSSSFDHRIVDGWDAASFVQRIRQSLEQPALLFVDGAS